jgi:hypothetical protein
MSKTNNFVLPLLEIVSWMFFVGLCIDAGGLIVNFIFSLFKPELVQNLYQKLDLSALYNGSKSAFFSMYSFVMTIAILKAVLFYIVIRLINKLDLSKPFNSFVSKQISLMSYSVFTIGILSYLARQTAQRLSEEGYAIDQLNKYWEDWLAYILMSAIVYVIANIFKKGLEIQNENDLTV